MACLDTTVLIDLQGERSRSAQVAARRMLAALAVADEVAVTTPFTMAELFVGVNLRRDPIEAAATVRAIIGQFPILEFTSMPLAPSARLWLHVVARVGRFNLWTL